MESVVNKINSHLGDKVLKIEESFGDKCIYVLSESIKDLAKLLCGDFKVLLSVTCTDFMDKNFLNPESEERFEVVYHFLNISEKHRLRVKCIISEKTPEIDSLTDFYDSANFMEREVFDMYGIKFKGHPDLRKILMYEEFKGHPLRKDYPLQGKQPRIKLRHPEVENTARYMRRPELVQISGTKNG